ncbi:MAG: BREX system P-loop protein BrxC [Lachnospiraceae bacterium]|nr:BREX system P-loop protein BrxC [Lachnospiraceae bacterium]
MKIKDILTIDLKEDITNVIDMENLQEEELLSEIDNYIVTEGLAREFDKLADVFSGHVKETGIWLSGFYGSGKSYLGKLWGFILSNPDILGTPARDRILQRFHGISDEALIRNDIMALESKDFLVVRFDIAKQNTNWGIAMTMMENFLRTLDIPENAFGILLFHMMMQDLYTDVSKYVADKNGTKWGDVRKNIMSYHKVIKDIFLGKGNSENDFNNIKDTIEKERDHYSAAKLKEELELFLSVKPDVEVVFLFDEASEAINQKKFTLLDLEGISEAFSAIKGRVWTMAIAQEKLDDVINNSSINKSNLTKMTDRFKTKIHIESTEVDVIIRSRLLKKTDAGRQELESNYEHNSGKITDTAMLSGNGLTKTDSRESYATYYPFYQYQLQLMQNFLFGKKGYTSTNVAARGMIISAYDILKKEMQEEDLFSTATAWQMAKQAQPQPPVLLVNRYESAERVLSQTGSPISGRSLLETIHFLEDADSAPTTISNILKAFISNPDDYYKIEKDVKTALDSLVEARILILNDNQYRITSDIEQRLLDEMNGFSVQPYVRKGSLLAYYKKSSFVKGASKVTDNGIGYDFYVTTDLDDEITNPSQKSLKLKIKSIYSISDDRSADINDIKNTYQNQQDLMYLVPDNSQFTEIDKLITEIKRIDDIADKYQRTDIEEAQYIRNFVSIRETKEDALRALVEKALTSGTIIYLFNVSLLNESNATTEMTEQEKALVRNVYTKRLSTQLKEDVAYKVIKEANASKLHSYFAGKDFEFFDAGGTLIGDKLTVSEAVLNLIKNTFVDGSSIESKLLEPPTGYLYGTVVSTVAALMRGGRIIAKFGGSEKYSYRDPDVDSIFKNATNFRKASFKGITKSLSASQKNDIVVVLKEFEAVDRNGKKVDWNTNDFDLVCAISKTAEEYAGKIKAWREANSKFDAYYPDMSSVESVLKQFIGNVNDQNYIDKAIAFISSKDAFSDAIDAVMSCSDFIKNRQAKAEGWKLFVQEVNDDLSKAARTVQSIALATNDFNVAFESGLMQKCAELQTLYQKIKDEYFKKYCEAAFTMSAKYETIKSKAESVIQEIETLDIEENAVLKSKAQTILAFAEGRICKNPKITTSIKEDNTKLTFSEVLSANDIVRQKETELSVIDAQILRQKPEKNQDDVPPAEGGDTPEAEVKKDVVSTLRRELPKSDITVSEYKTWLLSEIKTISAMKDTDKITF